MPEDPQEKNVAAAASAAVATFGDTATSARAWLAAKRRREKERRRERNRVAVREKVSSGQIHVSKREAKLQLDTRLEAAMTHGRPTVCLDCAYDSAMSTKEVDKLAMQLNRLYGVHRASQSMVKLCLTSYRAESRLATVARQKHSADAYRLLRLSGTPAVEFPDRSIVYLSPDAPEVLNSLDPDTVYVIGGLVDEQRRPSTSVGVAAATGVKTARFPIDNYVISERKNDSGGATASSLDKLALPVNVVFAVLCDLANGSDWTGALLRNLPRRLQLRAKKSHQYRELVRSMTELRL